MYRSRSTPLSVRRPLVNPFVRERQFVPRRTPRFFRKRVHATQRTGRRLSYERVDRPMSVNVVVERQHGDHMALVNNQDMTSFIGFPIRGFNEGRCRDYIKLLTLNVSGMITVRSLSTDAPMSSNGIVNGTFVLSFVLDKKPYLPDGVNTLPSFAELFGPFSAAYFNLRLLDSQRERFRLLGSVKKHVSCGADEVEVPFKFKRTLSTTRSTMWATFKDVDIGNSGGNYRNISKNAILVNYAFVSMHNIKCEPFVQYELSYFG
nr:nuclear shuttle protein [Dolichos yellow mosaic virus]UUA79848.1 nuclear shuttle protein [Dolichos yellow mosaic virus]